jgi:hypothetical protein
LGVRVVLLLVVSALAGGCGAAERVGGGPTSTAVQPDTESEPPFDEAEKTKPPPIVLETAAGRQRAVRGSSCVDYVDEASGYGVGVCADTERPSPSRLSTVRPGEEVLIRLEDAEVVRPEGCVSEDEQSCIGTAAVHPLGCARKTVAEIPLAAGPATAWRVELEPGAYEVEVFAYFAAADGRSGDLSGALGLLVDEATPLEIVPRSRAADGCKPA